jgi:ABC-type sugar transport system permease subunit
MVLPVFLLICIFKIAPIANCLVQSFLRRQGSGFTLENYQLLFVDKTFWNSLWVTLKFNLITIPLQIIIAFVMALLVNSRVRGIEIFRTMLYLPFCVSITISTVLWETMLNFNNGIINSLLGIFGIGRIGFLIDKRWALLSIILICSWRGCAYWMMFFLAGLKGINSEIKEAAAIDGAGYFRTLFTIIIPLLKNTFFFVIIANTTANFLLFAPVQIATGGGPQGSTDLLMYEAYKSAFKYSNQQRESCIVTILLLIIIVLYFIQQTAVKEKEA